jgi:hypothetical protein
MDYHDVDLLLLSGVKSPRNLGGNVLELGRVDSNGEAFAASGF